MGRPKPFLDYGGRTALETIAERMTATGLFSEVLVSVSAALAPQMAALTGAGDRLVLDREDDRGPLMGICTALENMSGDWGFVLSCDQPGITPAVAEWLQPLADGETLAVVPVSNGREEVLSAWYHRALAAPMGLFLDANRPRAGVKRFLRGQGRKVAWTAADHQFDPGLFEDVNTLHEYDGWTARHAAGRGGRDGGGAGAPPASGPAPREG
jgi:molybdopterin-guanine dinucleotide biosynthesis protein A